MPNSSLIQRIHLSDLMLIMFSLFLAVFGQSIGMPSENGAYLFFGSFTSLIMPFSHFIMKRFRRFARQ